MEANLRHGQIGFRTLFVSILSVNFITVHVSFVNTDTINTQVHEATKHTPYELVFGQPPRSLVVPDVGFHGQLDEEVLQSTPKDDEVSTTSQIVRQFPSLPDLHVTIIGGSGEYEQ